MDDVLTLQSQLLEANNDRLKLQMDLLEARRRIMELERQSPPDGANDLRLPPEVEAEITLLWGDNPAAASLARRAALARIRDQVPPQSVATAIRFAGERVE